MIANLRTRAAKANKIAASVVCVIASLFSLTREARAQSGYVWKNTAVSGAGCWVTGIFIGPNPYDVYIRTDVGGLYHWNAASSDWVPLTDSFHFPECNNFSIESVALDPVTPGTMYMACGPYSTYGGNGRLYKSTNYGASWTWLNGTGCLSVPMGGNEDRRWGGERLFIDPSKSGNMYFGSRRSGLLISTNSGASWTTISSLMVPFGTAGYGVTAVVCDLTLPRLFVSVEGAGVYKSTDNGTSWSSVGGPKYVNRMAISSQHVVWATEDHVTSATDGDVEKYESGVWTSYRPNGSQQYRGLAINPNSPTHVLVSDYMDEFSDPFGTGHLYQTIDDGADWALLGAKRQTTVPWYAAPDLVNVSALIYDPSNPNHVWAGDWSGIWRCDDLTASPIVFNHQETGHEQGCVNMLATPPYGTELFSGFLDLGGFRHNSGIGPAPTAYPTQEIRPLKNGVTDYAADVTSIVYQLGTAAGASVNLALTGADSSAGTAPSIAVSTNSGVDWTTSTAFPAGPNAQPMIPLRVAIAPSNGSNNTATTLNMVVMCGINSAASSTSWSPPQAVANPWWQTSDGGQHWYACGGLPASAAINNTKIYGSGNPLVADGSWGDAFFAYDFTTGYFWSSSSGGSSFTHVNTGSGQLLPYYNPTDSAPINSFDMRSCPGAHNDIWISFDVDKSSYHASPAYRNPSEGLWRSKDGGATWTHLANIATVYRFCFGMHDTGKTNPALYIYGRLTGDTTDYLYRSPDLGATWTNITDPNNPIGDLPAWMEGSNQTTGRVFVGTGGRGIFFGDGS